MANLSQTNVNLIAGETYWLHVKSSGVLSGSVVAKEDSTTIGIIATSGTNIISFTSVGGTTLSFVPSIDFVGTIDSISMKQLLQSSVSGNIPIKEFLTGNTDEGKEVHFRADTQILQVQPSPEMYSNPIAIATETERGSTVKVFVSIDEKMFYELEGTVTKGISIVKMNSSSREDITTPPIAKTIQLSYRDSSKQLCRINQAAIITIPTAIDHSP